MSNARSLRGLAWAALSLSLSCEAPTEDAPSAADPAAPAQQAPAVVHAAKDAPIAPGEHVPMHGADESPESLPDPAEAPDLVAALSRLAQRYASDWEAASAAFEAELPRAGSQEYQLVLGSAHCYRVIGASEAGLTDVDLLLFDQNGVQVQQDEGSDRFPVVGLSYPVCPPAPGAYRLKAVAVEGAGKLRVQAFHSP